MFYNQLVKNLSTVITRGWYICYLLFVLKAAYYTDNLCTKSGNSSFLTSKSAAYKQERLQIESGLWWRAYGMYIVYLNLQKTLITRLNQGFVLGICESIIENEQLLVCTKFMCLHIPISLGYTWKQGLGSLKSCVI